MNFYFVKEYIFWNLAWIVVFACTYHCFNLLFAVDAIVSIKKFYGVTKNWQGDPCSPKTFAWEGLNCSYDVSNPPSITGL